jgi:hypothetical protein
MKNSKNIYLQSYRLSFLIIVIIQLFNISIQVSFWHKLDFSKLVFKKYFGNFIVEDCVFVSFILEENQLPFQLKKIHTRCHSMLSLIVILQNFLPH